MRYIVISCLVIILIPTASLFSDNREGSAETFLARGKGQWMEAQPVRGSYLCFVFSGDHYCGGESITNIVGSCGRYQVYSVDTGVYYIKFVDQSGKIIRMSLEIINDYTILLNGRRLERREF